MDPEQPISEKDLGIKPVDHEQTVVQGVTTEAIPTTETKSESESLVDDFKELNRIYNGELLTKIPTKDGSEKMVFAKTLMVDGNRRAYIGGIDNDGLFLIRGAAADEIYSDKRFNAKAFGNVTLEEYLSKEKETSVRDFGKSAEERVTSDQAMSQWETSYRATKDKIDTSRLELPNVRKAREIVRQAISEQRPAAPKAA